MDMPVLILAAGSSSRMRGADKLMQSVGGQPLIRQQVARVLGAGLRAFVALPAADHPRAKSIAGLAAVPLFLPGSVEGMGGTLREGVAALPDCRYFMVMAADLPGVTTADLRQMAAFDGLRPIVIATAAAGQYGHPVRFDARLRPAFAALAGDSGAKPIIQAHRHEIATLALPGDHATRDLDTPEDWALWRRETGIMY